MFRVGAVTEDGVIEVFESRVGLILGFQFHPERLPAQARGKIFRFFISKVLKH